MKPQVKSHKVTKLTGQVTINSTQLNLVSIHNIVYLLINMAYSCDNKIRRFWCIVNVQLSFH